jgi:hypothetical protein
MSRRPQGSVASAASGYVCPVDDAVQAFVVGVVASVTYYGTSLLLGTTAKGRSAGRNGRMRS